MRHKVFIQAAALIRRGRVGEARAVAAARVGRQGELAYHQQAAVHVLHAAVHLARVVAEDAQLQNLGQQLVGQLVAVALLGTQQHQQSLPDLADGLASHVHTCLAHALQYGNQLIFLLNLLLDVAQRARPRFRTPWPARAAESRWPRAGAARSA
ncbi:hypothetical protein SDC9_149683 [bioreactor metagenome]|uniref:Uncharacterized protein n=1 Tax=bioreactor metagenome TaxID=1076179 RepID=A0A645EL19_9ZZZZ